MRNFRRSLKYLRPYRTRLVLSFFCVLFISVLWGGGLGMIAPALKILIDPEGLHGWAWRSGTENALGARIFPHTTSEQIAPNVTLAPAVLEISSADDNKPAANAGIRKGQWLIGTDAAPVMGGEKLTRLLATTKSNRQVTLRVFNPHDKTVRPVKVTLARRDIKSRLLIWIAEAVPEPKDYPGRFPLLLWVLAIALGINLFRDLWRFCQEYLVQTAVLRSMMDIRNDCFNAALRLPVTFYSSRGTSDTMSRFLQDTHDIRRGQVALFGKTLVEPAKAIGSVAMALFLSWEMTLVAMIAGPPTFILIGKFGRVMKRASKRALESWSRMLAVLEETLTGVRVVKAYTMESAERKRFYRVNRKLLKEQDRIARVDAATPPSVEAMGITAGLVAAGAAGYYVLNLKMDPFIFMAWMGCLVAMFDPLRKLAQVANRFQRAEAAAARVFELRDQEQEKRVPNAPMLPRHSRQIEFRGVRFRYPGSSEDALKGIDLVIPAGRTVAIVGPNGCGKTTLVSLVPRLLDPTAGKIIIDGQDIATASLRSLRRQIGLVTQDTVLFNATIAENVSYGLRRARDEAVLQAAQKAYVDEFVRELPEGYETMVGEHGATLSGGQKQRIAIARAILRDPAILIFDEATSQVDADSERRIHQAMEEFVKGRTTMMIAHRFATVLSADMIAVMDDGRIIDSGTHDELLQRCTLYAHLYRTQFADTGGQV